MGKHLAAIAYLATLAIIVTVGLYVWPTRWDTYPLSGYWFRVDRFSGDAQMLARCGWIPVSRSCPRTREELRHERESLAVIPGRIDADSALEDSVYRARHEYFQALLRYVKIETRARDRGVIPDPADTATEGPLYDPP